VFTEVPPHLFKFRQECTYFTSTVCDLFVYLILEGLAVFGASSDVRPPMTLGELEAGAWKSEGSVLGVGI
jgi:hypothetical protein